MKKKVFLIFKLIVVVMCLVIIMASCRVQIADKNLITEEMFYSTRNSLLMQEGKAATNVNQIKKKIRDAMKTDVTDDFIVINDEIAFYYLLESEKDKQKFYKIQILNVEVLNEIIESEDVDSIVRVSYVDIENKNYINITTKNNE